jgi:hypothetical protein
MTTIILKAPQADNEISKLLTTDQELPLLVRQNPYQARKIRYSIKYVSF